MFCQFHVDIAFTVLIEPCEALVTKQIAYNKNQVMGMAVCTSLLCRTELFILIESNMQKILLDSNHMVIF